MGAGALLSGRPAHPVCQLIVTLLQSQASCCIGSHESVIGTGITPLPAAWQPSSRLTAQTDPLGQSLGWVQPT